MTRTPSDIAREALIPPMRHDAPSHAVTLLEALDRIDLMAASALVAPNWRASLRWVRDMQNTARHAIQAAKGLTHD